MAFLEVFLHTHKKLKNPKHFSTPQEFGTKGGEEAGSGGDRDGI